MLDNDPEDVDIDLRDFDPTPAKAPEKKAIRYSVSLIKDFQHCPAKAYARITRQPGSKSLALVNGIAVHTAMEEFLKEGADPQAAFQRSFDLEADRNSISTTGEAASEKRAEGEKMVAQGHVLLSHVGPSGIPFNETVDPALVEAFFNIERDGRLWVGKFDLIHFTNKEEGKYSIIDFKTNKNVPKQYELDTDLQFSMYAWAAANDPKLSTYGTLSSQNVWMHLRGKNIAKGADGKAVRKVADKKWQYSFPTFRTEEAIERDFIETMEPVARAIESGEWRKDKGESCAWCPYFNSVKQDCGVDLPAPKQSDGMLRLI